MREWSWKIALLALPWQTRWFSASEFMPGGMPWEQGRFSLYAAWIPMAVTIFIACADFKQHPDERDEIKITDWMLFAGILLLGLPAFVSMYPQASWQWLTQVIMLVFFAWSLQQLKVGGREVMVWSVWSLVPHALLGIIQFGMQQVIGTKWLGMSTQWPGTPGVSVVELAGRRVLRAYGGFPHPNILGGWLVYGLVALFHITVRKSQNQKWLFTLCVLFTVALVLTFSRAAWIAAAVGLVVSWLIAWRKAWVLEEKLRLLSFGALVLVSAGLTTFLVRDLVFARVSTETRLEQKSVSERSRALEAGWSLVREQWWLGQGPNTAILALDRAGKGVVPPHFIPLLILLETGLIGSFGVICLLVRWVFLSGRRLWLPILMAAPLLVLDHYLWSLWAGQTLLMWIALLPLTTEEK